MIRPLIDCRRADVAAFAMQHCGELARDPSNDDPRHERVRVRKQLLPLLELEDPASTQHLADLADDARDVIAALDRGRGRCSAAALEAETALSFHRCSAPRARSARWRCARGSRAPRAATRLARTSSQLERAERE